MFEQRRIDPRWLIIGGIVLAAIVLNAGAIDIKRFAQIPLRFVLLFPAIILHEVSHGYVAYLLGDPTAKRAGRLTLNPIKHIDPIGTVVLPLVLLVMSGGAFFFGWAKPVPFNPRNFKDERTGMLLTGIAGPVTNIVLAIVFGLLARPLLPTLPNGIWDPSNFSSPASVMLFFCYANLVLAFFNLVPVPPLDGSRVLQWILPDALRNAYHSLERYGFIVLIGLTWVFPGLFSAYLALTVWPIFSAITGVQ
jgi:Zn-dependent protease